MREDEGAPYFRGEEVMVRLKDKRELELMRTAGRIVAEVLFELAGHLKEGVSTAELDELARKAIERRNARPSFLGYNGYPATICVSINEEVVHGIPGERTLRNGDIVSIDVGACYEGYHGDSAMTFCIGEVDKKIRKLVWVTRAALYNAIMTLRPGNTIGDVSAAVQDYAESHGFSVVRDYTGHGIGRELHEEPAVPNFGTRGRGLRIVEGMVLAIEPMLNLGRYSTKVLDNDWTVVTRDGKPSAHFEHTVAVTSEGPVILTTL